MKSVRSHRYAVKKGAQLFESIGGEPTDRLEGGSWMGVVDVQDGWFQVITAQHGGWVRQEDTLTARPFTLSAIVAGQIQNYILL